MNTTYDFPQNLGDLMGAYDAAHWQTETVELKPDVGVLQRGSVLSMVAGKLELVTSANQANVYGVLLDGAVDTAAKFSDNTVTGSVARSGSFRGAALLRDFGIFVEGVITPPEAAATAAEPPPA